MVAAEARQCPGCGQRLGAVGSLLGGSLLERLGAKLRFTPLVLWGCGALYLLSVLWEPSRLLEVPGQIARGQIFGILAPGREPLFLLGMSGSIPMFQLDRWWTPLTAGWLHGGLLHIAVNLLWIRHLGPTTERLFGSGRLVVIYTVSAIAGFALTSLAALLPLPGPLAGAHFTVGASAPLFGLFGALVFFGQRSGNRALSQQFLQFVVIWVVIGVAASAAGPNVIRIDNWAHLGGFAGGYLSARWLDPAHPQRHAHVAAALVCLAVTALAVAVSLVHGLWLVNR